MLTGRPLIISTVRPYFTSILPLLEFYRVIFAPADDPDYALQTR